MWFSDRPLTQQRLADNLASLLEIVSSINLFPFLEAFWVIISREWDGIDNLRIDKFYLMIRRYVAATFRRLKSDGWQEDDIRQYIKVMEKVPLNVRDRKIPNGIRFHMFDIYMDELERVLKEGLEGEEDARNDAFDQAIKDVPFEDLISPLVSLSSSPDKTVRIKVKEVLEDSRLIKWGVIEKEEEVDEDIDEEEEWGGFD